MPEGWRRLRWVLAGLPCGLVAVITTVLLASVSEWTRSEAFAHCLSKQEFESAWKQETAKIDLLDMKVFLFPVGADLTDMQRAVAHLRGPKGFAVEGTINLAKGCELTDADVFGYKQPVKSDLKPYVLGSDGLPQIEKGPIDWWAEIQKDRIVGFNPPSPGQNSTTFWRVNLAKELNPDVFLELGIGIGATLLAFVIPWTVIAVIWWVYDGFRQQRRESKP